MPQSLLHSPLEVLGIHTCAPGMRVFFKIYVLHIYIPYITIAYENEFSHPEYTVYWLNQGSYYTCYHVTTIE